MYKKKSIQNNNNQNKTKTQQKQEAAGEHSLVIKY